MAEEIPWNQIGNNGQGFDRSAQVMFIKQISEDSLTIDAPAKLNLYLKVLGKRPDGFHEIDSIFQAISLFDHLRFTRLNDSNDPEISIAGTTNLPTDESNLVARAFRLMQAEFGFKGGLRIELEKNIPVAAGLGGGSADGAATILACAALFNLTRDFTELANISAQIGSDLPFFFSEGQAHVTGRGEIVKSVELPLDYWIVLVTPNLAVSTAEAYAALKLPLTNSTSTCNIRGWKASSDLVKWLADIGNDFESIQCDALMEARTTIENLTETGAEFVRMSGSGPTVFGIYYGMPNIDSNYVSGRTDWRISTVRPIRLPATL